MENKSAACWFYLLLFLYYFMWTEAKKESNTSVTFKALKAPERRNALCSPGSPEQMKSFGEEEECALYMGFVWNVQTRCASRGGGGGGYITADRQKDRESEKIKDVWRGKAVFHLIASAT